MQAKTNCICAKAALDYAGKGFPVLPLCWPKLDGTCGCGREHRDHNIGKVPLTTHGLKDATQTIQGVEKYWKRWPHANIGIAIPAGYLVVDVDITHGGFDSLQPLQEKVGILPDTLRITTGSGGLHFWYKASKPIRNTTALGGFPGIDVRAQGGYVVAPPSLHRSGHRYEVSGNYPIADAPEALINLCTQKQPTNQQEFSPEGELIPPGQQNRWLFGRASAYRGHGDTPEIIFQKLKIDVLRCPQDPDKGPFTDEDLNRIARSAGKYNPNTGNNNTIIYIGGDAENSLETGQRRAKNGTTAGQNTDSYAKKFDEIMRGSGGREDKRDIAGSIGLQVASDTFRKLVQRRMKEGKVRAYHGSPYLIEWINRDYQITQLSDNEPQTFLNIKLPLKLHTLVQLPPGSVVGVAGFTSAGKTSLLLETAELNALTQPMKVYYWYNEMSEARFKNRCKDYPSLIKAQKQGTFFPVKQGDFEFADVLEPDGINLIDYLDRDEEIYLIGQDIKALQVKLNNGVVMFALQKLANKNFGYGGLPSAKLSNLYISLDKRGENSSAMLGRAEIVKAKDWTGVNPVGLKCDYHTGGYFGRLFLDGEWHRKGD